MTNGELLEAGMTTVANGKAAHGHAGDLEHYWYSEHQALLDYNADAASKATYNSLRRARQNVIGREKLVARQ